MAKGDKFYFENFAASTALSEKAANYLVNCLENYHTDELDKMLDEMHQIEHAADLKKHEMNAALAKAFVTPVDREDLDMLSHELDDVTDKIEEVLQKFYIFNITSVKPDAIGFAKNIVKCCGILCAIMKEFENFKKSRKLHSLIIELNDVEEECDRLYLKIMHELTRNEKDVLSVLSWREVFGALEACADACECVSECVESVIMKNT